MRREEDDHPFNVFQARYSRRDLMLYAVSIGCGSTEEHYEEELKFFYERNSRFSPFPTFAMTLLFWARKEAQDETPELRNDLPHFPPPMLACHGILPKKLLQRDVNLSSYPVLHTWQSMEIIRPLSVPSKDTSCRCILRSQVEEVLVKSLGTFVTSQTSIRSNNDDLICVLRQTYLLVGLVEGVVSLNKGRPSDKPQSRRTPQRAPDLIRKITIPLNASLLYRLASGDSNAIHVDPDAVPFDNEGDSGLKRPILHGLCTLGIVTRNLLLLLSDHSVHSIEAQFTKPVFVGSTLILHVWKESLHDIHFRVFDQDDEPVIRNGYARVNLARSSL